MKTDRGNAIVRATEVATAGLVPEIHLHLLPSRRTFEAFRIDHEADFGASAPYWAVAWPGGQALARFVLDDPMRFRNASVIDHGCGCGIAAIAAAMAGAADVSGFDRDAVAVDASALNSRLNRVSVDWRVEEIGASHGRGADYALAGDLWYERFDAQRATNALRQIAASGTIVLCGDVGRAYFPKASATRLASYDMESTHGFEKSVRIMCSVWALDP